jgi:hypothetical protein
MADLGDRLRAIGRKLEQCTSLHGFRPPGPPVPQSDVSAFESQHGVTLPEEYRAFLFEFGPGGGGPGDDGILPLSRALDGMMDPYPEALAEEAVLDPERKFEEYREREPARGTVTLTYEAFHETYFLLVVSGATRGRLCRFDAQFSLRVEWVDGASGEPVDFLAWYEDYLDRLLARGDIVGGPSTMLGDESSLTRLATDEAAPERLRNKAIFALAALPAALDARKTLVSLLERSSSLPAIKASALRSLNFVAPGDAAVDASARHFAAASEAVLHEAAYHVAVDSQRLDDVLLRLLDDANPNLVLGVFLALNRRGKITTEILGRLGSHPSPQVRQQALTEFGKMSASEAATHIVAALRDPDPATRRIAAHKVRDRRLAQAVPALEAALAAEKDPDAAHAMARALEALR